jgi:site-specific DNA-methyltransferase (adenine-specific)
MLLAEEKIGSGSVDLIFTDPPYPQEFHYCYEWLAKEAMRALKPEGFLIAYAGPYWKDVVMNYFNEHLQYFYDFILVHKGNTSILWPRRIISGYKSILCYHKKGNKPLPRTNVLGQWDGTGGDKRFHYWGQDENTARYYVDCFSKEGDLVVDYFLGGGTTAKVCKKLNRNFIGFENDNETFKIAQDRLNNIMPVEKAIQEVMELG